MVSDYEQNTVECGKHEMMNMNSKDFLTSLQEMRLGLIEHIKKNDFGRGFRELLSDRYPDKAHFIYELLQNAEDAEATEVIFQLTPKKLTLKHNGTRIFDKKDVEGITGIGTNIQKKDDINAIGKFGVGFKAVFAYTESPRIYSRDFSFEIKDLFCPYPIETIDICDSDTQFVFPFNNPAKRPEDCFSETAEGLNGLSDITLLFLNNIKKINWDIEGHGSKHITHITTKQDNIIEIKRQESNTQNPTSSFWLRFQRKTKLSDKLKIGVAFKLKALSNEKEADGNDRGPDSQMKIDSEIHGHFFIYFPAEKETTGLNFHINGPYASTIDRASIPHDHNDNKLLLEETATLLAESLPAIRDAGYLTRDFLDVLPNKNDVLAVFYQPFIEKISSAMKEQPLMPTTSGTHVRANDLLRGDREIRRLIGDDDLCFFTGKNGIYWAPGAIRNSRVDRFLQMLEIDFWNENELVEALEVKFGAEEYAYCSEEENSEQQYTDDLWLSNKTDEWIQHLYAYLANIVHQYPTARKNQWRILRTEDNKHLRGADDVFFPTEESAVGVGDVSFIKSTILFKNDKSLAEKARTFLEQVDVEEVNEEQKIRHLLEVWYSSTDKRPKKKKHIAHVKRFVEHFRKNGDVTIFQKHLIFKDFINGVFREPHEFFIDKPFIDTGVACIFEYNNHPLEKKYPLSGAYQKIEGFSSFALEVGVWAGLKIEKTTTDENPDRSILRAGNWKFITWTGIDEDYMIPNLEKLCKMRDKNISKLIWVAMSNAKPEQLWARFKANQQYDTKKAPSQVVHVLRNSKWMPNLNGEFYEPAKITKENLNEDFTYDDRYDYWLSQICFGENARVKSEAYQQKSEMAEKLGIKNLESIELIKKIEENQELYNEIETLVASRSDRPHFPTGISIDPEHSEKKMIEKIQNAPKKEYVIINESKRITSITINPDILLRGFYTNREEQMICQICKNEMPFKKRDGQYYFEAVESFDDFDRELEELYLALCPVCAAKYKEFIKRSKSGEMQKFKSCISENDSLTIPIHLDEDGISVHFIKKHIDRLKTIIQEDNKRKQYPQEP